MHKYGLGIDLGTTQTAAAVNVDGRIEVVRLGGRRAEIPSLVFVRPDGGLLIGEAAERRGQAEPGRLAREFKRRIGDPVPILAGGVPFSAHALTAKLLRHVLDAVTKLQDGPPAVLTVTHPANWGPYKREQLDQALRLADAGPVLLRTEPEAAALQHATARKIAPGETVAVYDLGGGTFDAAVLRREGDGFLVLGEPEGIEQLGGADFDEAVFGHVLEVLGDRLQGLDPQSPETVTALARLRRDCVEAKEALSFDTEVMIPVALPGVHTRVRLNRSELESMIAPALADTVATMHRALRAARVEPSEIDAVLLAGGSSRIPLVGQLLTEAFGRPVVADPHPEHSIAMGAAVSTALITGGPSPFAEAVTPLPRTAPASSVPVTEAAGPTEAASPRPPSGLAPAASPAAEPATADQPAIGTSPLAGTVAAAASPPADPGATPRTGGAAQAHPSPGTQSPAQPPAGTSSPAQAPTRTPAQGQPATRAASAAGSATVSWSASRSPARDPHTIPAARTAPTSPSGVVGGQRGESGVAATQRTELGSAQIPRAAVDAAPHRPQAPANGVPVQPTAFTEDSRATRIVPGSGASSRVAQGSEASTRIVPGNDSATRIVPGDDGATRIGPGDHGATRSWAGNDGATGSGPGGDGSTRIEVGHGGAARVDRPVSGGTVHGSAAPGGYLRGAASVPELTGQVFSSAAAFGGDEAPPGRRNGRLLVLVGVLTLAVIAGTTVLVALNRGEDKKQGAGAQAPATPPASPSVSAPPYPIDTILIRVDSGGGLPPERKSSLALITPGQARRTSISDTGRDILPVWSHDRERLALTRLQQDGSKTIWVMDADGKNSRKVAEDVAEGRVSWSTDDSKIAFMGDAGGTPQIFVLELGDGDKPVQLTRAAGQKDDPAWSPDGKKIAYWAYQDDQRQLFVLDVDDPDEPGQQLTKGDSGPGVDPAWSPDGGSIAYTRGTGKRTSDIWVIGSDGKGARQLTDHKAREMDPSWSPDGSWLAFVRGVLEEPKIVIAKADGSDEVTLTKGDAREGHPCWS